MNAAGLRPSLPRRGLLRLLALAAALALLGGCAVFSYQRGLVFQRGLEKLPLTLRSFRIEGSGFSPVFDESARLYFEQALRFEGFDLRSAAPIPAKSPMASNDGGLPAIVLTSESNAEAAAQGVDVFTTLLVTRPEILSSAPASYALVVEGRRSGAIVFSHTFMFRHPWGDVGGAFMGYFSSAARHLRLALAAPGPSSANRPGRP
ncbi:MAG: hypothetical protein J0L75_02650 [Spirochaetes bacterium]|nr:hypothetical protein [Spirochaetota bacterium]